MRKKATSCVILAINPLWDSDVAVFKLGELQHQGNARTPADREMWITAVLELVRPSIPAVVVLAEGPYRSDWYDSLARVEWPLARRLGAFKRKGVLELGKWACYADDVFRIRRGLSC